MCGFVGYIDGGETQLMEPVLHAMADRISHRCLLYTSRCV